MGLVLCLCSTGYEDVLEDEDDVSVQAVSGLCGGGGLNDSSRISSSSGKLSSSLQPRNLRSFLLLSGEQQSTMCSCERAWLSLWTQTHLVRGSMILIGEDFTPEPSGSCLSNDDDDVCR